MVDGKTIVNVLIALVVFKLIDKLFLDNLFSSFGNFEEGAE